MFEPSRFCNAHFKCADEYSDCPACLKHERDDLRAQLLDITMRANGVVSRHEHDIALREIDLLRQLLAPSRNFNEPEVS